MAGKMREGSTITREFHSLRKEGELEARYFTPAVTKVKLLSASVSVRRTELFGPRYRDTVFHSCVEP